MKKAIYLFIFQIGFFSLHATCFEPLNESGFQEKMSKIKMGYKVNRLEEIKNLTRDECLSVRQIGELSMSIDNPEAQFEYLRYAKDFCFDEQLYMQLGTYLQNPWRERFYHWCQAPQSPTYSYPGQYGNPMQNSCNGHYGYHYPNHPIGHYNPGHPMGNYNPGHHVGHFSPCNSVQFSRIYDLLRRENNDILRLDAARNIIRNHYFHIDQIRMMAGLWRNIFYIRDFLYLVQDNCVQKHRYYELGDLLSNSIIRNEFYEWCARN